MINEKKKQVTNEFANDKNAFKNVLSLLLEKNNNNDIFFTLQV